MTSPASKTIRRGASQAERKDGIPPTLLFFILKQLEAPHRGIEIQPDDLQ